MLWRADSRGAPSMESHWRALRPVAFVVGVLAVYYFARWVAFLAVGPDDLRFRIPFGSGATTLLTTVMLIIASFSMSTVTNEHETRGLRIRASHDGLTGLLNRTEFMRQAAPALQTVAAGRERRVVDHRRPGSLQDRERPLWPRRRRCRVAALRRRLPRLRALHRSRRPTRGRGVRDAPARLQSPRAESITAEISRRLRTATMPQDSLHPTVSYGIAFADTGTDTRHSPRRR